MIFRIVSCGLALAIVCGALLLSSKPGSVGKQDVRPSAVAGSFYPAGAAELGRMLDGFLAQAKVLASQDVVAIVSPHAGYIYSGPVAAHSYALLKGRKIGRVIVIAPSHYEAFGFSSVYDGAAYSTPLGQVPVDRAFATKLAGMHRSIQLSGRGHTLSADKREHSLEVQLPFLQRVLGGGFKLVPIVMGDQSYDNCRALGVALAKLLQGSNDTLIVASSDLSHYHPYDEAVIMDHKTLQAIEEWDYLNMSRNFEQRTWEACGGGPIIATMIAAERLGANQAKLLKYANSGDTAGDHTRVVGYGAVALIKAPKQASQTEAEFSLTQPEKDELLKIARTSVEMAVREKQVYQCPSERFESLKRERGAFVTLTKHGELRGCIGYIAPTHPLYLTVRNAAAMAALRDTRFSPVAVAELSELEYEISVLSPLTHVLDVNRIRVGRHGLMMRQGDSEGLLLPQVAAEHHWDRLTLLQQTCRKAGLSADAWRDPDTDIFMFTALVFGERGRTVTRLWHPRPIELPPPPPPYLSAPSAGLF